MAVPRHPLFRSLLPREIVVHDSIERPLSDHIFPEEFAQVAGASDSRKREYLAVRAHARTAMVELGLPAAPILRGPAGAPIWPVGIVGSMTHCRGYQGAALASKHAVATIGIDAEVHRPLPNGVLNLISSDQERSHLRLLGRQRPEVAWDCVLFSAKEAVYKAWFPVMRTWLDFLDVSIRFNSDVNTFEVAFIREPLAVGEHTLPILRGTFGVLSGYALTAIAVADPTAP